MADIEGGLGPGLGFRNERCPADRADFYAGSDHHCGLAYRALL